VATRQIEEGARYFDREYFRLHEGKAGYLRYLVDLLRRLGVCEGRVLDLGSGYGFFLAALEAAGYQAYGVEVSAHAAAESRRWTKAAVAVQSAEEPLPFPSERFAAVTLLDVIEHLQDYPRTLAEAARTLEPGGALVVITLNRWSVARLVLGRRWSWYQDPTHRHLFDVRRIASATRDAGLAPCAHGTYFNFHLVGESTPWLKPLRRLARVVRVPCVGDSLLVAARKPRARGSG
jgi:SAM-dependent methyltransferase